MSKKTLTLKELKEECEKNQIMFFSLDSREQEFDSYHDEIFKSFPLWLEYYLTFTKLDVDEENSAITLGNDIADAITISGVKLIEWEEDDIGKYLDITCGHRRFTSEDSKFTLTLV